MANAVLANLETPSKDLKKTFAGDGGWKGRAGGEWDSPTRKKISRQYKKN